MKYAFTKKTGKFSKTKISTGSSIYKPDATIDLERSKREQIERLINEINRRTEENYHL